MAELFGVTPQNITIHLKNVYKYQELDKESTSNEIDLIISKEREI
jgi:hypothetical protein